MQDLKQLESKALISHLDAMVKHERKHQVEILRFLAELDERRVVVEMGYSGMWDFSYGWHLTQSLYCGSRQGHTTLLDFQTRIRVLVNAIRSVRKGLSTYCRQGR